MPRIRAYMGIDPGAKGSLCLIIPDEQSLAFITMERGPQDISDWIGRAKDEYALAPACLEEVHSLYGMSAKSNFSFGMKFGEIQTILKLSGISWELVQPKAWQKEVGIKFPAKAKPAEKKKITAEVCDRLYPGADIYGPKGGLLDGNSDALMIAHYARLRYKV